jgi:hypothetical protein
MLPATGSYGTSVYERQGEDMDGMTGIATTFPQFWDKATASDNIKLGLRTTGIYSFNPLNHPELHATIV